MPQPGDVVIRDLRPADVPATVDVLAASFLEFPALQVMVGSGRGAPERMARLFAMELEPDSGMSTLVAEVDGRVVGALTYLDSPACSMMSAGRTVRFMRLAGPRLFGTMRMLGRIERVHPRASHRHLPTIGVEPRMQQRGIGHRLMEVLGMRCDADGKVGYLETIRWTDTARPSHERFYGRLGYAVSDVIPMTDEWSVLTMTRPPAGPAAA